ncbi:MAG: type II secretion system minor pseudopilin GspK [Bdellovibrionales bacterium]|nr:type II secretion system minor pseudopilin GspK [Bdellovibrionales bacterium]
MKKHISANINQSQKDKEVELYNLTRTSFFYTQKQERGLALLLALFIVALASIIVVNLTYSSFLGARLNDATAKGLQAEYLLKSTVNVARAIIKEDTSPEDTLQDSWGLFVNSQAVPAEMLGINEPNVSIELEISPENSSFPLRSLLQSTRGPVEPKWRDATVRLFQLLGFDEDGQEDQTGLFPGRVFTSEELVSVLIDAMDSDSDSYPGDAQSPPGIEGELAENPFTNSLLKRVGELVNVPGFTPARMRKLSPLATVFDGGRVNINLAPPIVLKSLHEDIGDAEVDAIMALRKETPFDDVNRRTELSNIIGSDVYEDISTMIDVKSRWFRILAKVDYGSATYFMRAYVSKSSEEGELPVIRSVELF